MSSKTKQRQRGQRSNTEKAAQKSHGGLSAITAVATVAIGACTLLLNYKYNGAEEQRKTLYRPLYTEVSKIEADLGQDALTINIFTNVEQELQQSGELGRLPKPLREKVEDAYSQAMQAQGDIGAVETVERAVSAAIERLRTQQQDESWRAGVVRQLQFQINARPGTSAVRSFTMSHIGHSPVLDMQNPNEPRVVAPGSIRWGLQDWLAYPDSASMVEQIWGDDQFLSLHDSREDWRFRITREDLKRNNTDLRSFLAPIHQSLIRVLNIRDLSGRRKQAAASMRELKTLLRQRIDDPKRISDLFSGE